MKKILTYLIILIAAAGCGETQKESKPVELVETVFKDHNLDGKVPFALDSLIKEDVDSCKLLFYEALRFGWLEDKKSSINKFDEFSICAEDKELNG